MTDAQQVQEFFEALEPGELRRMFQFFTDFATQETPIPTAVSLELLDPKRSIPLPDNAMAATRRGMGWFAAGDEQQKAGRGWLW